MEPLSFIAGVPVEEDSEVAFMDHFSSFYACTVYTNYTIWFLYIKVPSLKLP